MKMKQLLTYTSTLLRTALLFGALAFVNISAQAQTAAQRAELPDAFETMDPATIIGDGNYYYIQFYDGDIRSYLTDCGVGVNAESKDFLPYANNRLWTLLPAGDDNDAHFYLKNKAGHFLYFESGGSARVKCTNNFATASILQLTSLGDGYRMYSVADNQPMYRNGNAEWSYLPCNAGYYGSRIGWYRIRFVKLKSNSAFIIYYRGEEKGDAGNSSSTLATTRHYLTYSGTAASSLGSNWWSSEVSSQQSIIPADKPLPSLPTVAAYHKDGLWTIEEADVNGQFYIKKYGTNQYLNENNHNNTGIYDCALGGKDATKGTYTIKDPSANRYTLVQNVKYETTNLTADMFNTWNGYGADATSTGSANLSLNYGTQESPLNDGSLVAGTGGVLCQTYADLSTYQKMTINGTPNMQLRVLMNRQEHDSGPYVEKNITIGSDGTAVVDLTDLEINRKYAWPTVKMTYVDANDAATAKGIIEWGDPAKSGYNNISEGAVGLANSGWGVNYLTYLQVDASTIQGTILKATLKAKVSGSLDNRRNTKWGVGYNDSEWSSGMTWNSTFNDRNITQVGEEVPTTFNFPRDDTRWSTTYQDAEFNITQAFTGDADKILTLLVYELEPGGGNFKEPVLEIQYEPTVKEKIPYAHLNAIKRGYDGLSGIINSISLAKENNTGARYLHHAGNDAGADGWQVLQWTWDDTGQTNGGDENNNWWYAGFYPVEVVDEDEFYQVKLQVGTQMVGVSSDSKAVLKPYNDFNPELWTLEQFGDYRQYRLKSWDGTYYSSLANPLVATAPTSGNGVFTNSEINSIFSTIEWVRYIPYETRIKHNVTHKISNVKLYYDPAYTAPDKITLERQAVYRQQGLITNDINEWWDSESGTQKVNEFKITHYVKMGTAVQYGLPTVLTQNNDHRLYQRWYKYKDDNNLESLKNHFKLGNRDNRNNLVEVMYYLYNNGIVTGDKLDWPEDLVQPNAARAAINYFQYYNYDGSPFTLAADVSRYSDFTYKNASSHLDGDLEEPSLTMRYIYEMHDAKEMARELMTCTGEKWYEKDKEIHFPASRLNYESSKKTAFQGEFLGIRHVFRDYWVFNTTDESQWTDENLIPADINNTSGRIEIVLDDELVDATTGETDPTKYKGGTGITLGGHKDNNVYKGYYLYDEGNERSNANTYSYGDSRFIAFNYPAEGTVNKTGEEHAAYLKVYFNYNGTRYQIARFRLIFDEGTATLPWTSVNNSAQVMNSDRDPNKLEQKAGKPIAKITFDYPAGATYKTASAYTIHNKESLVGWWHEIPNSSPVPLTFENTNYGFDGNNPSWGSYALVSTMETTNGYKMTALPADAATYGYNIDPDDGMEAAFLYIDASEQPGDICKIPFYGQFCEEDKLICSGWISGSNRIDGNSSPGSVTISVKGERTENGRTVSSDIYRFCPGQCYELDNGTGVVGSEGANHVVWQQFYFEFKVKEKYDSYWVEVNNNCVSSMGGDFMLDNIEVYALVPEATPMMNTPICINKNASEMQLLKISVGFDKLLTAIDIPEATGEATGEDNNYAFVFLEKNVFLTTFQNELSTRNGINKTIAELEAIIQSGEYGDLVTTTYATAYQNAFNTAVLGNYTKIWDSNSPNDNKDAAVLNFHWNTKFSEMPAYSFADAVNKRNAVFAETDSESGERLIVMNGNYPNQLPWKINTDYYIVPDNAGVTDLNTMYEDFNIFSMCSKKKVFQIKPPLNILSMETSDITQELEVCEGKIPTLLTNLKGFSINGDEVPLKDLNFDWWLGDLSSTPKVLATLENYHSQTNDAGTVRLDESLAYFRAYYPGVTSLEGITQRVSQTPFLTLEMIYYLQDLVDKGQLVLHQKSISIPAEKASDDDPYFYLVACPIHDGYFDQALNNGSTNVAYLCDEPQGLRMKVSEKAPSLKCGFVPNENGFSTYSYPDGNPVLSIRLAKKAQFETVKHGTTAEAPKEWETNSDLNFLWLPIRDAKVQSTGSSKVIVKSDDYNIYLASTDDPTWDNAIYTAMSAVNDKNEPIGSLPIVGKIVKLNAIDTEKISSTVEKDANRLCIYFTENFEVREGYNYTLSLPFREDGNANTCDGTLLIHLKIVPDYEVWTGGAGTTDWNNDQNWRRADGNRGTSTEEPKDGAGRNNNELLVSANLPSTSGLYNYTTNFTNYRTAKDRLLRKGYAPLYCTHILIKSNEWGDDPVLYDALAGKNNLDAAPFPNLSESYEEETIEYVDERYESIEALNGKTFAIFNETEHRLLYGTTVQNLGYDIYDEGVKDANTGYYFKLESVEGGYYLLHLQKPEGGDYEFDAWGSHWQGYLNSQPLSGTVSFILGLTGTSNQYTYGQDGNNLALWDLQTDAAHPGKFALKNVGTGKYLKDNSNARYNNPTFFTFCTLKKETVTTTKVKDNILKYDMQARVYDIWNETYGSNPDKGRTGDLIAEMYQINSCDEIAFQPTAEMLNAHLLNYNNAWVEYELDNKRWYLLGSSLQGTISGEWYAPTGTAQQKTTYYEPVTFGEGYDRYSPAIYQRSWDKAKAVLYEVGSEYATTDDSQTEDLGNDQEGAWSSGNWPTTSGDADEYLDRLGYKPFADKKANVAIKGVWSNTYNDATVDYSKGAFSVMVMNHLKNNDQSSGKSLIRLPKEDTMYDYYRFSENGSNDGGTDTYLSDPANQDKDDVQTNLNRAKNRGRLKSDMLLPASNTSLPTYQQIQRTEKTASRYGDQRTYTRVPTQKGENGLPLTLRFVQETVSPGISNLGFFLVENPFQCGLSMDEFFSVNNQLETKYWLLTPSGQQLVQQVAEDMWITPNGTKFALAKAKVAPGQGFFVQAKTGTTDANNIKFTSAMQVQTRYGKKSNEGTTFNVVVGTKKVLKDDDGDPDTPEVEVIEDITEDIVIYSYVQDTGDGKEFPLKARTRGDEASSKIGLVITAQRGNDESNALVMVRDEASDDFLPSEDTETFISTEDLKNVPTVYTLCGRLATTINSIHDFTCLPLGVESSSETACVLTFNGVEQLGDSVGFYDAVERKLTPLKSGMKFTVSGQTQNRYYLVSSLNEEKVAEETHLQIFTEGLTAKVIASTAEPITSVRCFDMSGRLIHTATPQTSEYSFTLPKADIYIIEAQTEKDRKTKKVMVK